MFLRQNHGRAQAKAKPGCTVLAPSLQRDGIAILKPAAAGTGLELQGLGSVLRQLQQAALRPVPLHALKRVSGLHLSQVYGTLRLRLVAEAIVEQPGAYR